MSPNPVGYQFNRANYQAFFLVVRWLHRTTNQFDVPNGWKNGFVNPLSIILYIDMFSDWYLRICVYWNDSHFSLAICQTVALESCNRFLVDSAHLRLSNGALVSPRGDRKVAVEHLLSRVVRNVLDPSYTIRFLQDKISVFVLRVSRATNC